MACVNIVFYKPWEINLPSFLHENTELLEAVAFENECISEKFMDDPDLIFIEMNGNALWDFRSIWMYFTFTCIIVDLKNNFFFVTDK